LFLPDQLQSQFFACVTSDFKKENYLSIIKIFDYTNIREL